MSDNNSETSTTTNESFYAGINRDGDRHVLVIEGKEWFWPRSKYMNKSFNNRPIGYLFNIDSTINDNTLEVDWETFSWLHETTNQDVSRYALDSATGKKTRSIKSASKKMDSENLRNMTLQQIREEMVWMTKQQKAAAIAVILAEVA